MSALATRGIPGLMASLILLAAGAVCAQEARRVKVTVVVILASDRSDEVDPRPEVHRRRGARAQPQPAWLHARLDGLEVAARRPENSVPAPREPDRRGRRSHLRRQAEPRLPGPEAAVAGADRVSHRLRQISAGRHALQDTRAHSGSRGGAGARRDEEPSFRSAAGSNAAGRGPHWRLPSILAVRVQPCTGK